ncbi:MAG: Gfo/Idh/MocA family oxidoreductase [Solidesulfovibrio sp.]|jgi:predicted dehydrogenase|uniref:Gfo/Idh/MocA family protein n=1 Tax=Solidesulfovibrio sp. TaxID=2910990 RepID=UPI002B202B2B|nr:Gfo/Idh/MocA family oxidoreductase [Solidesulfovibrio sp.]MEA4855582.1 Gfo/Idh/MocA family oxidoreductase [Solidesulfovibrio sp.]
MEIKTGIIGMGKMGRIRKQCLDAHPDFRVTALCDNREDAATDFPGVACFTDWRELLAQDLDAVFVCTYNNVIADIVCAALARRLHVFSEKPPGHSIGDVRKMMAAEADAPDRVLKFGFNHRFHYGVMEAKSIVDSGQYGEVLWARGIYGKAGGITFENSWRSDKDLAGGGILLDQGIHMVDLLRYFLGDFTEIKGFVEKCYWTGIPFEDNAFALMKTDLGKVAMLHSSATQWKHKFSLDIFMQNGYVCINGILSSTRSYGEESISFAKKQFEDEATAMGKPREEIIYFDRDDSWKLELEDFHQAIRTGNRLAAGDSSDALKVMQLIEDIYNASGK